MLDVEHKVSINRPVTEVFEYVADQSNETKWHTDVLEVDPMEPLEMGSEVTWLVNFMGRNEYVNRVIEFEPNERIKLISNSGPLKVTLTHAFEGFGGGTRYTRRVQIRSGGAFRIVGPIMRLTGVASRHNARFAENLKGLLTL